MASVDALRGDPACHVNRRARRAVLFKPAAVSAQHWSEVYVSATDPSIKRDAYRRMVAELIALDDAGGAH